MKLEIKIFTGETTAKYLQKLCQHEQKLKAANPLIPTVSGPSDKICHTGHTSKNICPIRTVKFQRNDRNAMGHEVEIKYITGITI